ncbi:MAG: ATP-binding cassette domain-containing protein [bacterium]
MFTPLSDVIAGWIICGPWCSIGGGLAGVVDEALIHFNYTDKRHLTWVIFGIATGQAIKPTVAYSVAGIVIGILLPIGALNDHQELIAPALSAIAGNSISGTSGAIGGGVGGVLDEVGIYTGVTDKHYATFCAIGIAIAKILGCSSPIINNSLGVVLGVIASNYENEILVSLFVPVKTTNDLYTAYNKFIPKEELDAHIEKHAIALLGSQFLVQFLSLKIINYQQKLTYNFERLDNPNGQAWNSLKSEAVKFAIFLIPYAVGQAYSSNIDGYFCKKLHASLEEKIREELFSGETALRLSHDGNATALVDNLKEDISSIVNSGSWVITGSVSALIGGVYGVGIVMVNSPNIFIYSSLYSKAGKFVSDYFVEQRGSYDEEIIKLDSKLTTILKHDNENIRTITERSGLENTKKRIQKISTDLRTLEEAQKLWSIVNNIWWSISGSAEFMFNYYLVSREINLGRLSFENRSKVQAASWRISSLLSWSGQNAQTIAAINQSLDRIIVLAEKIHSQLGSADQINRINQKGNQLILQDLEVGVEGRLLVAVKNLKLEMGKIYAVTGETSCGKTSLLSKIRGIKENGISGTGFIYYPLVNGNDPKIIMLSQQDYFPLDASLQEIIYYPDEPPSDLALKDEVRRILKWVDGVEKLDLDSKKDWYTVLSGGEKKKIAIVSAIIKKPDILILDEIFNGLDSKSVMAAQQMLKKYLPNTLMLSVDHHAHDNNYNFFYNGELHFFNKGIKLQEMSANMEPVYD